MKFTFVTLFPEQVMNALEFGVVGRALKNQLIQAEAINPRRYTTDRHQSVDDRPYGGGDGMVMMVEPVRQLLDDYFSDRDRSNHRIVHLSPQGRLLTDALAQDWARDGKDIVWVCSRYAGIDERFVHHYIDEELSVGDYIVSGGELPACLATDAIARHRPGVLGNADSPQAESFANRGWLEAPQYTRPEIVLGERVPAVLLSGNHERIQIWREAMSLLVTAVKRSDLLQKNPPLDREWERALTEWQALSEEEKKSVGVDVNPEYFETLRNTMRTR